MAAPGRGSAAYAVAVVLLALACLDDAYAATHTVGGSKGWNLGVDYTSWAAGETFSVGDVLFFPYTVSEHNVVVVNKNGYDACSDANANATLNAGNDNVTITSAGTHYYLCSVVGHCSGGMKLAVTVSAAAAAPAPTASTSAPTASTSAPTKAPAAPPSTAPSPAKTVPSAAPASVLSPVPAPETPASVPAPAPAPTGAAPASVPIAAPASAPPVGSSASPATSAGSPPSPPPNAAPSLLTSAAAVTPLALILATLLAL